MLNPFFDTGDGALGATAPAATANGAPASAVPLPDAISGGTLGGTNVVDSALEVAATAGGTGGAESAAATPPGSVGVPPFSHSFHYDAATNSLVEDMGTTYGPPMALSCAQYGDYCRTSQQAVAKAKAAPKSDGAPYGDKVADGGRRTASADAQPPNAASGQDGSQTQQADAAGGLAGGADTILSTRKPNFGLGGGESDLNSGASTPEGDGGRTATAGNAAGTTSDEQPPADPAKVADAVVPGIIANTPFLAPSAVPTGGAAVPVGAAETDASGGAGGGPAAPTIGGGQNMGQQTLFGENLAKINKTLQDVTALNAVPNAKLKGVDEIQTPQTKDQHTFHR